MIRAILALFFSLSLLTSANATTLKIATIAPDGTSWMKTMRAAAKQIKTRTEGRVKLRFYPGGVMGNDQSVLRKIRVNQLHGGAISGGGLTQISSDAQLYGLPFLFRNLQEVDHVRQSMDPLIAESLHAKGFASYGISEGGFAYLLSNSPVRNTQELKSQRIWIPETDQVSSNAFSKLGISPIPLPLTDVLTGLQTGLIDTIASSPIGAIALQWHTRVKYLTDIPLSYLYGSLVIKEKALKKLSSADRAILREEMLKAFASLNTSNRSDNKQAKAALKQQGIEFIQPDPADRALWEQKAANSVTQAVQDGALSKSLFEQLRQLITAYRRSHPN